MRSRLTGAIAAGLLAAALAGCGSGSGNPPEQGAGPNVGESISLADCSDWNQATSEQRLGTLKQLQNFAGSAVVGSSEEDPAGRGAVLDEKKAYDQLNGACEPPYAQAFKLYKLYQRAAAFAGTPAN